jgi:N-acetylglucosamine kinase-like BadF-type ATPase
MGNTRFVIGIDGGGTRSRALLMNRDETVLAQDETGGSNPNVVGFQAAAGHLRDAILGCCTKASCSLSDISIIVLGLAGMGRKEDRETLLTELSGVLFTDPSRQVPIVIETDARIALEGAFGGSAGVILVAGTGSIIMGKTHRGEIMRVGGWGRQLGDEGSGFAIGKGALASVTHDIDGRGYAGALRKLIAQQFRLSTRDDIIEAVYRNNFDFALLAPLVMQAAADNDLVAQKILDQEASLLVEQCADLFRQMGVPGKVGLVMFGGLVQPETIYSKIVQMKIMRALPQAEVQAPLRSAVEGAIILGLQKLKSLSPPRAT